MRIYKDLDMVEQLGSGMNRILSFYKKDIFIFDEDFLRMVFISNYDKIKTTQETDPKTLDGKMQNV
jgi:predicted HTH transcriptional regulator